eukprot:scaffold271218_cov18-Tisochrysis_lutea.AAC.1
MDNWVRPGQARQLGDLKCIQPDLVCMTCPSFQTYQREGMHRRGKRGKRVWGGGCQVPLMWVAPH